MRNRLSQCFVVAKFSSALRNQSGRQEPGRSKDKSSRTE